MALVENGGAAIADVLAGAGVPSLFTLCGGHISPILVECRKRGIRIVDVRDEASAVFAADAVARLTGIPGVAAVTAGPGVTNAVTAVKNAQMAETPLLIFGGATATILKGRGSLQDIDQMSLMAPITKWTTTIKTVSSLGPTVHRALETASSGVPGPVFIEVPVDLLYPEELVESWYLKEAGVENPTSLGARALRFYLKGHLLRQFHAPNIPMEIPTPEFRVRGIKSRGDKLSEAADLIARSERPALVIGSQALVGCRDPEPVAEAVRQLGVPTFLGGMARGLMGRQSPLQFRHKRGKALKEADVVLVAGFPFDFRLGYGRGFSSRASVIAANLSSTDLRKNRRPEVALEMHPAEFLKRLGHLAPSSGQRWSGWFDTLREREAARDAEIVEMSKAPADGKVNPIDLFVQMEEVIDSDSVLIVDGGDFAATAAYTLRPRAPLSWLDPGVFGTLGVGGGFAVGAKTVRPEAEVWLIYGDGSSAYSLAEFDTCARHGLAPIAVIGTDGSWAQIAREQVEILGEDTGTVLARTDYHRVAEGYGGAGLLLDDPSKIGDTLAEAKALAKSGKPVCINVHIAATDFRKGSISM